MNLNEGTKNIKAVIILEILGKPKEHLVEVLEGIIKKIDEEKGVGVKESKINEPTLIKDQQELYTTFAEIEIEVDEIMLLTMIVFKYMPSHVDIISPESIKMSNNGWNEILNEITRRLHGYDEVARVLQNEKMILENKLKEFIEKDK